jgi:FtsH-binding integral membrane protein
MNHYDMPQTRTGVIVKQNSLVRQVYAWMGLGLATTAIMSIVTVSSPDLYNAIVGNKLVFYGLMIGELALVFTLSGAMSVYGYTTRKDLTTWGSFLFMGLMGVVIASLVNIF